MTVMNRTLFGIVLSVCFLPVISSGADEKIEIKELPKAVTETIKQRYPKGELSEARKTSDDGQVVYEVDLTDHKTDIEIAVLPDGKIHWVAIDIEVKDLPKVVTGSIRKKYPAGKLDNAAKVYVVKDGKDQLDRYNVEVVTKAGKHRDLEILLDGTIDSDEDAE